MSRSAGNGLEIVQVPPKKLKAAPYNPRQIDDGALARLKRGIEQFGLVDPLVVRKKDRMVIGGHQRLRAAQDLGLKTVPVVYLTGLSDQDAAALNVLLNNPKAQGEWDMAKLSDLLSELDGHGYDATLTGFDTDELEGLLTWTPDGKTVKEDDVPPVPEAPKSQVGEVYELGRHRVLCGDSTQQEAVTAFFGAFKPDLMVTDPPYGVEYDPEWRTRAAEAGHLSRADRREGQVPGDDSADWGAAWAGFPGDVVYCWHAGLRASTVEATLLAAGFEVRAQIVWHKPHFVIGRGHYHVRHEPCWYAVRKGQPAGWQGDRSQETVWEDTQDRGNHGHGTQKPVALMARSIRNHKGDVFDPFLGSGTTLIAAEQLGRTCYGVEIEPKYVDVIRQRYANLVGDQSYAP